MKDCGLGDKGVEKLLKEMGSCNLTELQIGSNNIEEEGAQALALNSTLTTLNLYNNGIGDEGAKALALNSSLTTLNLNYNGIGDEGAKEANDAYKR